MKSKSKSKEGKFVVVDSGWINIYRISSGGKRFSGTIFDTEDEARAAAFNDVVECEYVGTTEIEWEEKRWLEKQCEQKSADKVEPKFKPGDKLVSTKNPRLTYKVLNVGNVNELGNLEYEIEMFIDGKPGLQVGGTLKEHNIHLMECVKVDKWAKLVDEVKPKWTEADEAHLHSVTTHLEQWIECHPNTCGADIQSENLAWLESLKQRLPKMEEES